MNLFDQTVEEALRNQAGTFPLEAGRGKGTAAPRHPAGNGAVWIAFQPGIHRRHLSAGLLRFASAQRGS